MTSTSPVPAEPIALAPNALAAADGPRRRFTPAWSTLALVIGVALALASLAVEPPQRAEVVRLAPNEVATQDVPGGGAASDSAAGPPADGGAASPASGATPAGGANTPAAAGPAVKQGGAAAPKTGVECAAGKNGGSTDVGVTGSSIKLGATVVQSGIGASFLGDVRFAMQAIVDKTNRAGGICGRLINLKLVDDGWSFQRGGEYLRNLIEGDKVFALAVVPSSEGLKNLSDGGYLKTQQVPVVGSDGMLIGQYNDPYIWPVAASTVSTMHIMAKQAFDAGAKDFGLVYESTYHFGIEGAFAFNAAVKRLTGKDIEGYSNPLTNPRCQARFCGINADADSYSTEIQQFNTACQYCNFVGLLLEPTTATKWMKGGALRPTPSMRVGGVQPLFTSDFGTACGIACHGMWLWTGYTPPLGDFLSRPAIATYVNDIKAASSSADFSNSFVEGGYVGMQLVVKGLETVGPNLTRANLKVTLDSMAFDSGGLAPPLKWSAGNHFANVHMQAFSIQFKGGFNGWRDEQTGYDDPWVGQDAIG
jgi:ABC-type branched-subunit amino acid transport system substrate-binding protein